MANERKEKTGSHKYGLLAKSTRPIKTRKNSNRTREIMDTIADDIRTYNGHYRAQKKRKDQTYLERTDKEMKKREIEEHL